MDIFHILAFHSLCFSAFSIQWIYCDQLFGDNGSIYSYDRDTGYLGRGMYAEVVRGTKIARAYGIGTEVALKFEKRKNGTSSLQHEAGIYKTLKEHESIPKCYGLFQKGEFDVLVIELLSYDLDNVIDVFPKFSIKTTMMIGLKLLNVIEYIHQKGIVHDDIKPSNVGIGLHNKSDIYLLDYGSASYYKKNKKSLLPTGSRKQDLISIVQMLMNFLRTDDFSITTKLNQFLSDARQLDINAKPKYKKFKQLLLDQFENGTDVLNWKFDWN